MTPQAMGTLVGTIMMPPCYETGGPDYPAYTGSYRVTPQVDPQTLGTKDKVMTDDLVIKAIPYYDVGNEAGGSTVYIGKEL